ncbi:hypothetical protein HY570_01480 [Candidatus Micrarchaeota archaeon]|nr:hypothetical protein [Candidatus Micrarchaeota archaeon]
MDEKYLQELENTQDLADIFELVKDSVEKTFRMHRAGLTLGLVELGGSNAGFLGGYHTIGTNIIIMNSTPLQRIKKTKPEFLKPYTFVVLAHEYLHTLGVLDELQVRKFVHSLCRKIFGEEHITTQMALDLRQFIPYLTYKFDFPINENMPIKVVDKFDRSSLTYIK